VELKTIFATAPDAIVSLDDRHNVIDANAAAEDMFGMSAAELKRQSLSRLIEKPPADVSTVKAAPGYARRGDEDLIPVELSFGSGIVEGRRVHIGVMRNMAERKAMEEKLRERDRHLDRTLRVAAAAEMASALAHELNQPLTAASAYVQSLELLLARHGKDDPDLSDAMRKTVSEVARAGTIVRRLREFYRRDAGKLETVAPLLVVDNALAPLAGRIDRHRIAVSVSIASDAPMLLVDRVQIEMVLHNVIRNAVDSLAESEASVRRIDIFTQAGQPGFVTLGIEDSGPGVSPAIAEQIFSSFATSRSEGTGLGLAISRSIVERHGGRLWLDESSAGARFMITLPAARA
jgi:two-component system sensor kinase FixL